MPRTLALALCLLSLPSLAHAQPSQPEGRPLRIFDKYGEQYTIAVPPRWSIGPTTPTSHELFVPPSKERPSVGASPKNPKPAVVIGADVGMLVTIEVRRSHAEALRRLSEIASEQSEPAKPTVISGWPAIEHRYRSLLPQPGENEGRGNIETWFSTTAVAVESRVIRFESTLAPDLDPRALEEADAVARSLRAPGGDPAAAARELDEVMRHVKPAPLAAPGPRAPAADERKRDEPRPGAAVRVQGGVGELEVAASNDGSHVVVAANSGFSFSDNFGATWTFGGGTPCTATFCDGDPSLAVGQSGAIYYAWIGGPARTQLGDGISRSTDNGHTFPFAAMAVACPGASSCSVADQEHIAADRANAGALGDRVYNVWRNFPTAGAFSIRIVCSANNGTAWGTQQVLGAGDLPRVGVGRDGFVYAAWASGGNLMLHKYSNCDAGLVPQAGFPVVVSAFSNVACAVPGLDRCNGRNILSSPVVAGDDLDANHIYYAFATSTGAGNEDVMVFDSNNGGSTFPRSVRLNAAVAGRRFMPWLSTYGGTAVVSWYDRRTATAGNNDRTRFRMSTAAVRGPNLVAGTEVDLSGVDDTQCSGWPCGTGTNNTTDSESCSAQPQPAGVCLAPTVPPSGSATPCDFSTSVCVAPEACVIQNGCPKYGDYNGNAAAAGRAYSAWASFVTPTGAAAGTGLRVFTSTDRVPSDFFVRDWTASATSHDLGQQPSTNPVFWATSDLWNQSTATAVPFPLPADWIPGDPPSRTGSNFAFARVSRRAAAASTAPAASVSVTFLQADYGLGVPYSIVGTDTVSFAAGDMTKVTPGRAWTVPATSSIHLCLGVQITGPEGDAFAPPSLDMLAVGPSDPLILIDNNKAQRNLQDTVGTPGGTEMFAIVENASPRARAMEIGVKWPPSAAVRGRVAIVGGEAIDLGDQREARIKVGELKPRERRWLKFSVVPQSEKPAAVDFFDTEAPAGLPGAPSNGFTIQFARAGIGVVARRNLRAFADVLTRVAVVEKNAEAKRLALAARRAAAAPISAAAYIAFLKRSTAMLERILASHLRAAPGGDPFEIRGAADDLGAALKSGKADALAAAHNALNERLDAHLTMLSRS